MKVNFKSEVESIKPEGFKGLSKEFLNTLTMYNHQRLKLKSDLDYLIKSNYLHYINKIYLFGSCSKGTATVHSDIDLGFDFITVTPKNVISDLRVTLNDISEYGVETNIVQVPIAECRLKSEILKGVIIYDRDK